MKTALSIAGSDCSGGAGIQADLKTMTLNGVFAMSAITALTAQNTTGVSGILEVSPAFLAQQIDAVFTDIRPDAVKIGMVSSAPLIATIAERLRFYQARHIVVDPVMVATSGSRLMETDAVRSLREQLFPLAEVITPNRQEAEVLSGRPIHSREEMLAAARTIAFDCDCSVLLKGGHSDTDADDLLVEADGTETWFAGRRIANPNTHGTGCTLSSAIAANLAKGYSLPQAIARAKGYITAALSAGGVTKAAVETVAENFADGVAAPMFYMLLGGAPLALCYKAVNTMDSMVGYKNERYLYFGRAAAKLDDAANYLPARMAALLLAGAAALTGQNARGALRIGRRDRRSHASPNSAQTEAVMAGALGVQLAGPASYFGKLYEKPTIGDALRPVEPGDILRANRMLYAAGTLCMALLACARAAVCLPLGL